MSTVTPDEISGISLPFRFRRGRVATAAGTAKLRANLAHILLCSRGERAMARDYGVGLRQLLHDPNNDALQAIVQHEVTKGIARYEPRIRVLEVRITQEGGVMWIRVHFVALRSMEPSEVSLPIGMTSP